MLRFDGDDQRFQVVSFYFTINKLHINNGDLVAERETRNELRSLAQVAYRRSSNL